ncbi:addiction module toxin, HicA family [Azospirillum melinis]|uniref:Addiction module toxin, HicA family n=1 Tax=Azospirillum melinis TaxID=328839 RepID=A0ABX2KLF6_9PROT|nr:type II toxin-antitoxin system HicA family toxin [Azospirillum melinis]MBP2310457.1 putative RNA binding protein YcfA (HicA-like mRNA interferase family) [Azospirillum melinis]NUB04430.1 addiction module toxin, HicA family [Azospirillum melinis]
MPKVETNRADIIDRLTRDGWVFARHGSDHDVYRHPDRPATPAVVPRHRTLSPGVARQIAKVAGWI